jgi:DNA-binding response OmpR family regulator
VTTCPDTNQLQIGRQAARRHRLSRELIAGVGIEDQHTAEGKITKRFFGEYKGACVSARILLSLSPSSVVPEKETVMNILVVEDQPKLAGAICKGLSEHGYSAEACDTALEAERRLGIHSYDLIILDIMLPDKDGFEVCRATRERLISTPILMLTALAGTPEKVKGLEVGADDYLTKPFDFEELVARVHALLRRGADNRTFGLRCDDLELNLSSRTATRSGRNIALSGREAALLEHLMRNQNRILSRQVLAQKVWGLRFEPESNVIDVYISALRRKIDRGFDTKLIHTVVGAGYRFGTDSATTNESASP